MGGRIFATGRVIQPVVVDEQQYLALVEHYRGVPRSELQATCLYAPFTNRSGIPWVAHWLPFEEGLALGVTNVAMLLLAVWLTLLTLRTQGAGPRVVLAAGALFAIGWNPFYFGTAVLVDPGVLAAICLCWYLLVIRRPWFVWPILLLGYPLKETVGIIVPVMAVWAWQEYQSQRRSLVAAAAPFLAAAVAYVAGVVLWRQALPESAATWDVAPDVGDVVNNLTDVLGLATFVIGVAPFLVPSFLRYLRMARADGWFRALIDPAVVGVVAALGLCAWSILSFDLTPRFFWIGYPFAATLAAQWFSEGRPSEWLEGRRARRFDPVTSPQ